MNKTIIPRALPEVGVALSEELHPVLRRIYAARGVTDEKALDRELRALLPLDQLAGAEQAAVLIADLLSASGRILVVADFDCDGATSCALALLALRAMGAEHVDYLVPNRFEFGYGLTPEIVALAEERRPDLIITVDNGISSVAGVAVANAAGIPVIVTDHHLPGDALPEAAALVDPNLPDNPFPAKSTAGVGVIFYVMLALRAELRRRGHFQGRDEPNMADYLDLVALGTVADVVALEQNNRILVHQGLKRIRAGRCRPGILALLAAAGRNPPRVQAADMGFFVAPRLNAAGRLDDMSLGIECLLANTLAEARPLAAELDRLNHERRSIEEGMKQQAEALLNGLLAKEAGLNLGLCLYDDSWHQGVIGILASRIKERYHRPVIAFALGDEGELKGSARSLPGLHIRDLLDEMAAQRPGLLRKFGGHAMAAGLTLEAGRFDEFSALFDQVVRRHLREEDLRPVIHSDGEIAAAELNMALARLISEAGPWGQAFPEPVFHGDFEVVQQRLLQDKHWKLVLRHVGHESLYDAIGFGLAQSCPAPLPERVRLAYQLDINEFRGNIGLQLRIVHLEAG